MGKGSMAIPNRQLIKDDLDKRYDKLVKEKKIKLNVFRDSDEYYFHFEMPSESERENTYDVVLHFTMGDENFKYDNFLDRYYVKFFSNCPSFTYTFAYAFNLYGLLIDSLGDKYESEVLNNDPVTRNPGEIISYEKSIYFACRYLSLNKTFLNKMYLNGIAKPFNVRSFNNRIRNSHQIKLQIDRERVRVQAKKKEEEEKQKKASSKIVDKVAKAVTGKNEKNKISGGKTSVNYVKPKPKIQARKSSITKSKPK